MYLDCDMFGPQASMLSGKQWTVWKQNGLPVSHKF